MRICEVRGGILSVTGDLYWDAEDNFKKAIRKLLTSSEKTLTIDLTEVKFILSPFMGHIVRFCLLAEESGKIPKIVITYHLEDIFQSSGLMSELPFTVVAYSEV